MSDNFKGTVAVVNRKKGSGKRGPWFIDSFKLVDENGNELEDWFKFGFNNAAPFAKGDFVEFSATKGQYGYEVDQGSGKISKPTPAQTQAASTGPSAGPTNNSQYWQAKFTHEVEDLEPRARAGFAREFALKFLQVAFEHDAVPLSAAKTKAGQAKREEELMAILDKYTVKFARDIETLRLFDTVADAGEVRVPEADVSYQDIEEPTPPDVDGEQEEDVGF